MTDKENGGRRNRRIAAAVLALCVLFLSGCTRRGPDQKNSLGTYLDALGNPVRQLEEPSMGIDVSSHQGVIDWQKAAEDGVEFAIIRVGYRTSSTGAINVDANADYNLQKAAEAGIRLGAYFVSTAVTPEEAREEATWVADFIAPYSITYPVAYDCEDYLNPDKRHSVLTKTQRTEIALAFLEQIEICGYEGMFYSARNSMADNSHWLMDQIEDDYKVWVAQYPGEVDLKKDISTYEGHHQIWQYTASGKVAGIEKQDHNTDEVDMNVAYFSYDGVRAPKDKRELPEPVPDPDDGLTFVPCEETVTAKDATNLRSIPSQGSRSQVCHVLRNGETAVRIGTSPQGWSKLIYEGGTYYSVSSYLTTDLNEGTGSGGSVKPRYWEVHDQVTAKERANLRSEPVVTEDGSGVVDELLHGEIATRVGLSDDGWSMVQFEGQTYYVVTNLLEPAGNKEEHTKVGNEISGEITPPVATEPVQMQFEPVDDVITATSEVRLRDYPNTEDSEVIHTLVNGETAQRTGINREAQWSRVIYKGRTLYCASWLIETVKP